MKFSVASQLQAMIPSGDIFKKLNDTELPEFQFYFHHLIFVNNKFDHSYAIRKEFGMDYVPSNCFKED